MATNNAANIVTAATGKVLQGAGVGVAPTFSTATYPSTATSTGTILRANGTNWAATTSTYPNTNSINTLLYASAANVLSELSTANNGILITSATGVPSLLAAGTTGQVLTATTGAPASWQAAATSGKASFSLQTSVGNPADATTYYMCIAFNIATFTSTNASARFYIPISGTINIVYGVVSSTPGTSEATTIAVRKNDTSNSNVSTSIDLSSALVNFNNTSLGLAVTAGDFIEFIIICPTWVTNPTSVKVSLTALIS